jgi:hypothetical protein
MKTTFAFCLLTSALLLASGCANRTDIVVEQGNYRTINHPFTEAGAAEAQHMANEACAYRQRVAVKTYTTCTLDRCASNFECMSKEDAAEYASPGGNKPAK